MSLLLRGKADGKNLCYHFSDGFTIGMLAFTGGYVDAAGYAKLQGTLMLL
jgi:hypothetical protein